MKHFIRKHYLYLVFIILGFMAVVSTLNANNDSLIYDEAAHIPAGYSYLTQHDMRLNPEHPPLLKDMAGFPLLFLHPKFNTAQDFWTKDNADASQWNAGKVFIFNSGNDADRIIFWSRIPIILLSLLFGLFIFKWTRELAGLHAGLIALILYAFDPNILGHNHFVTTDLGIAAFITFAFYYFLKFIKEPTWKNVWIAGIFLGLVQLTKFSAVLTFPIIGLILIIYPLVKLNDGEHTGKLSNLREYCYKGFVMFLFSLVIVWIGYYLNTYNMPQDKLPEIMSYYLKPTDTRTITIKTREIVSAINSVPALMPFADYVFGVARVFQRVAGGNVTYFFGQISTLGFTWYFPIIFLIKEPLPTLFLILFSFGVAIYHISKALFTKSHQGFLEKFSKTFAHYLRTSIVEFSMLLFIILYVFTSIKGGLNIGFRHLFPILPFIYILTAKTIARTVHKVHEHHRVTFLSVTVLLLGYLIAGTVAAYPSYTSYFNELVGGPKNGYNYATDSNADWGQDLKRLKIFLAAHPEITNLKVDYFGMADLKYYIGDKYEPWWGAKRPIKPGWYAISTLFLQESLFDKSKADDQSYRWLNRQPRYQVGTSILIYYVDPREFK